MALSINLLDFKAPKIRILHYTWFAFFISFLMWFSQAPLMPLIKAALQLTDAQVKSLLIINVAMTIPARILVGIFVDKFGPRTSYALLLAISAVFCFAYALADDYEMLAITRFLVSFVGAGFVIGIRLVSEWFPAKEVGFAEGVYGGWGNFGMAAASAILPALALWFGGENGWRYAVATTGLLALAYSVVFYIKVRNTPKGSTYFKPKKLGGLEITSVQDFWFYVLMNIPMFAALAVIVWRLSPSGLAVLSETGTLIGYIAVAALLVYQLYNVVRVNKTIFTQEPPELQRYKFKQVAILNLSYMATFGSEIAVESMLPLFFVATFKVSPVFAGLMAASFAVMNLFARPFGGWLSDRIGRRKALMYSVIGTALGYLVMSQMNSNWWIAAAIVVTIVCSICVQAACGAVYGVVPLIQRRMTGQVAGMVGAYGNVGSVVFLTVFSFVAPEIFFIVLGVTAALVAIAVQFLDEPKGHMAEVDEDGNVHLIELS
ncbi:MAG TPA: NarK family nitrate/nitrite MFS transporter [Pseudomonadales bacterium]|nr:NarK family nitrate/nitrite MFS transporter [Pseudomonadales bacterium]